MQEASSSTSPRQAVDATDWLKAAAIISTAIGHVGFFSSMRITGGAFSGGLRLRSCSFFWATGRPGPSRYTGSGSALS